jgi:Domain of unknown function (DUF4177)
MGWWGWRTTPFISDEEREAELEADYVTATLRKTKYEYLTISTQSQYQKKLNEAGQDGWELVGVIPPKTGGEYSVLCLMRVL